MERDNNSVNQFVLNEINNYIYIIIYFTCDDIFQLFRNI